MPLFDAETDFEPGPIAADPLRLPPRVTQPREFEGLAADFATLAGGLDGVLGAHVNSLAPLAGLELEGAFTANVVPAYAAADALGTAADGAELAGIVASADAAGEAAALQMVDLPGPDETTPGTPSDPAPPPGDPGRE